MHLKYGGYRRKKLNKDFSSTRLLKDGFIWHHYLTLFIN